MTPRQNFLDNNWLRYPAMPSLQGHFISGRVSEIGKDFLKIGDLRIPLSEKMLLGPAAHDLILPGSELFQVLKAGDQVVVQGDRIWLLAPCYAPPPELTASAQELKQWRKFVDRVRGFFQKQDFLEVSTPTLVTCPGTEPFLDLFSTEYVSGKKRARYYLPTSPELHLKKMLAAGHSRIFEMRPCFRNGEISENHQPEFWMLEWYRTYANLKDIIQDTKELVQSFVKEPLIFEIKSMRDLFKEKLNFDLTPQTSIEDLKALGKKHSLAVQDFTLWDDVFYFIFIEKIEHNLGAENPLFLVDYPPSQAALARLTPEGWGDRFELYWRGLEIANAFHELNDPSVQALRFQEDLEKKKDLGKEVPPLDQEFMRALESGLPPSGGIALGLERLFMALNHVQTIEKTRAFALKPN